MRVDSSLSKAIHLCGNRLPTLRSPCSSGPVHKGEVHHGILNECVSMCHPFITDLNLDLPK